MRTRNLAGVLTGLGLLIAGCQDNASGPREGQNALVQATASAAQPGGGVVLGKSSVSDFPMGGIDSLRVDQAILVLKDIAFKSAIDSEHTRDSMETEMESERDEDRMEGHEGFFDKVDGDGNRVHFKGPFVVVLHDTTPVQIAVDTIPPGTYNGIKFIIHKLRSKDLARNPSLPDSLLGYSIAVSGSVRDTGGVWKDFVFKTDIDEEFKAKGEFTTSPGDMLTPFVLKFDLESWFRGYNGRLLDPNNAMDRWFIRAAIKASLKGHTRCGRDRNHDGDPD